MRDIAIHRATDGIRPPTAPRPRRAGFRLPRFRHWGAVRRYGIRAVLWPAFAVLMGGIVLNATAFQSGHHPAPLVATVPEPADPLRQAGLDGNATAPAPAERAAARPDPVAVASIGPVTPPAGIGQAPPPAAARRPAATEAKPAHVATTARPVPAHPRPGQPHAPVKPAVSGPKPVERQRLAAMMAAVNKGRPATAASN